MDENFLESPIDCLDGKYSEASDLDDRHRQIDLVIGFEEDE